MERIQKLIKRIKRGKKLIKFLKVVAKIWKIFIAILGPAMSIFLLVDGFLNKDDSVKKQPVEGIEVTYE